MNAYFGGLAWKTILGTILFYSFAINWLDYSILQSFFSKILERYFPLFDDYAYNFLPWIARRFTCLGWKELKCVLLSFEIENYTKDLYLLIKFKSSFIHDDTSILGNRSWPMCWFWIVISFLQLFHRIYATTLFLC